MSKHRGATPSERVLAFLRLRAVRVFAHRKVVGSALVVLFVGAISSSMPAALAEQEPFVTAEVVPAQTLRIGETVTAPPFARMTADLVDARELEDYDVDAAQAYARTLIDDRRQFTCLVQLWDKESHWRVDALNSSSGAYGIPQALPGKKMASAGQDWRTSAKTQIRWGVSYIERRYGSPCEAWEYSRVHGWY